MKKQAGKYGTDMTANMAGWGRTVIAVLMVVALVIGSCLSPNQRAYADNITVIIEQNDSVASIQTRIQYAIDSCSAGETVTVIGSRTDVSEALYFDLRDRVRVIWKATYKGNIPYTPNNTDQPSWDVTGSLITVDGYGYFEVAEGADIVCGFSVSTIHLIGEGTTVRVSGGTVHNNGFSTVWIDAADAQLTVSGGVVSNNYGWSIFSIRGLSSVTVSGGLVTCSGSGPVGGTGVNSAAIRGNMVKVTAGGRVEATGGGDAIVAVVELDSTVTVEGGMVTARGGAAIHSRHIYVEQGSFIETSGNGYAIKAGGRNSGVWMRGGTVGARQGFAILVDDGGSVADVSGGFVFAYGKIESSMDDVIIMFAGGPQVSGSAVVCAWNQAAGKTTYVSGTSVDLTSNSGTEVRWSIRDGRSGITYMVGSTSGFYAVPGVTVTNWEVFFPSLLYAIAASIGLLGFVLGRRRRARAGAAGAGADAGAKAKTPAKSILWIIAANTAVLLVLIALPLVKGEFKATTAPDDEALIVAPSVDDPNDYDLPEGFYDINESQAPQSDNPDASGTPGTADNGETPQTPNTEQNPPAKASPVTFEAIVTLDLSKPASDDSLPIWIDDIVVVIHSNTALMEKYNIEVSDYDGVYTIVNEDSQPVSYTVTPNTEIRMLKDPYGSYNYRVISIDDLKSYLSGNTATFYSRGRGSLNAYVTIDADGNVLMIDQFYLP